MPDRDTELPPWLIRQLTDRAAKRGKGQQPILVGAIYRGKYMNTWLSRLEAMIRSKFKWQNEECPRPARSTRW